MPGLASKPIRIRDGNQNLIGNQEQDLKLGFIGFIRYLEICFLIFSLLTISCSAEQQMSMLFVD